MTVSAQQANPPPPGGNYDPYLNEGFVDPAPMLPAEFGGTGVLRFKVGTLGGSDIPWVQDSPMLVVVTLARGVPNAVNPLDAIGGPGAALFSWTYNPVNRTYTGSQIATIVGNTSSQVVIQYKVVENSLLPFQNGFNANLTPPTWIAAQNTQQPTENDTVEALTFVDATDFGDAPAAIYTAVGHKIDVSIAENAPVGPYNRYMYLGSSVDPEPAYQSAADATGDDASQTGGLNLNDEDGVVFPTIIAGSSSFSLPVSVTIHDYDPDAAIAMTVRGWIDWNNTGGFVNTTAERLIDFNVGSFLEDEGEVAWSGPRTFNFNFPITVPPGQSAGNYFARFRFGPSVTPTATLAPYGEVEDYLFEIQPLLGSIAGVVSADTNGDGTGDTTEAGVLLSLLDSSGNPVLNGSNQPITTTTDSSGSYIFENVPPGSYQVVKTPSGNYESLSDADGGDADVIGTDSLIVVVGGVANQNNNFLEYLQACPDQWTKWQTEWETELNGATDPLENPDGDRYNNLLEYAFCLPPHIGVRKPFCLASSLSVTGGIDGVYHRTAIGGAKDVIYTLEWSTALGAPTSWTGSVVLNSSNTTVTNTGDGSEIVRISDLETLTGLSAGSGFVRIRVDLNDGTTVETAATDVLGWVETEFGTCCSTYNNPFLACAVFTGTIDSVNGQDLVLTNSAEGFDLGSLLVAGAAYYIEVETGDFAGHRFDVVSGADGILTLASDVNLNALQPPFNTVSGAAPALLATDRIALHPAKTLDQLFPPSGFNATTSQATADRVQLNVGGQWVNFWLMDGVDGPRWVSAANATGDDLGSTVIPPGRGMFFDNRSAQPSTLLAYGEVREHGFANPLAVGTSLVGGGYPIDQAPKGTGSRQLNLADGFFGSRDFKSADSIFRWTPDVNPASAGYSTYFLLSNTSPLVEKWVLQNDASRLSQDAALIFERDRSVFLRVRNGAADYIIPAPWTPNAINP